MSTNHTPQSKRIRPGVKALIVHEGKVLMIHERVYRQGKATEIIDFPGGGIEFGENLEEALKREVKEEINLEIEVERVVGAWDFVLGEKDHHAFKDGVHIVCIGYQCKVVGELTISTSQNPSDEDIYAAAWYTKEELLANTEKFFVNKDMITAVKNLV